jgi:hypothetical protein
VGGGGGALTRAVVSTRISRDPEGEALGVERQRQDCLDRAAREGWQVLDVLVENDVGASSYSRKPRPLYAALLKRGKLQRARQGQPMTGGGRPFGYANDRLTVIEDEAAASRGPPEGFGSPTHAPPCPTPGKNLDRHPAYILAAYMTSGD